MTQTPAFTGANSAAAPTDGPARPREHSEVAAEGTDGTEMREIRMHSQDAAEGPDRDV